jgi:hypothetical protein
MRSTRCVALPVVLVACAGCMSWREKTAAWEGLFRPLLLASYEDFRGHRDLADDGVIVVSYRIPPPVSTDQVLAKIQEHITSQYPCYAPVHATAYRLELRCAERDRRHHRRWEDIRMLVDPTNRRVFLMVIDDVPSDPWFRGQVDAILGETQKSFKRE